MFWFGTWFFQYKLSFLTTRFPAFLLLWRCEMTPWLMDAFWVPRVHRLVDSDAPALHTGGSSYHNRFYFSNFESSLSLKARLLHFFPLYWKISISLLFSFFRQCFCYFQSTKFLESSSSNLRFLLPFWDRWFWRFLRCFFPCFVDSTTVFLVSSHGSFFAFFTF